MKRIIILLLLLFLISGIAVLLSNPDFKRKPKALASGKAVVTDKPSDIETVSQPQNVSLVTTNTKADEPLTSEKESKAGEEGATGIDLNMSGDELKQTYVSEPINDYGWKSYWENELFVILMESSRTYPFVKQESICKRKTCKVEVTLSTEKLMYIKQATQGIDQEFTKRKMPIALAKIDVKAGVIEFYVQPGELK